MSKDYVVVTCISISSKYAWVVDEGGEDDIILYKLDGTNLHAMVS